MRGNKQLGLPDFFLSPHPHRFLVRVSSDGDDRMGQNIETQKSPWTKNYPQKNPMLNFRALTSLDVLFSQNYAAEIRGY